jgi:very-short-patch-repair endonuclease
VGALLGNNRKKDDRIPRARKLRHHATDAERKLWQHLRRHSLQTAHFRRQATIGPYFVDFACHTTRLAIEIDGGHHGSGLQKKRDDQRDKFLKANGYRILRFWNNQVIENIDGVLTVINDAIEESKTPPTPDPSPQFASLMGGGELRRLKNM